MSETAQQYTQRLLGYVEGKQIDEVDVIGPRQEAGRGEGLRWTRTMKPPGTGTGRIA
jgi:hypothetical protein